MFGTAIASCAWPAIAEGRAPSKSALFTVARSKNANVVRYVARVGISGLDQDRPVDAHWLMLAEDGRREELSWAERQLAYGFSVSEATPERCVLRLVAFKQRALVVARQGETFRATLSIAGKRATLERIFVQTSEGGLLPSVEYLEVFGTSADGKQIKERVTSR